MQLFLLGRRVKLLPGYRSVVGMLLIAAVAFSQITSASLAPSVGAQSSGQVLDLPAMTIRPTDLDDPDWVHQGAYIHAISDQARDHANYIGRGTDEAEVRDRLTAIGWQQQYVSYLSLPSKADPAKPQQVIRSYVTEYANADGAIAGFAYLEDESLVATASDIPLDRSFGEQSELTGERGIGGLDGRQFRSIDLTFRSGNLVAGVTLIQYPTADRIDPDIAQAESLAAIMEQRIAGSLAMPSALGAEIVRLEHEQSEVVTFDDAYYRIGGTDISIEGESPDAATARAETYADAVDVYQMWQGIDTAELRGALYGVTLLRFPDAAAAEAWLNDLAGILATNPFYGDIQLEPANLMLGDQSLVLSYAAGGGGATDPHSLIVAVRVGSEVARVHLVPQGTLETVPLTAVVELASAQVACLAGIDCDQAIGIPPALMELLSSSGQATPSAVSP
jgi:hypothetical protein